MSDTDLLENITVNYRHLNDVMGASYDRMIRLEKSVEALKHEFADEISDLYRIIADLKAKIDN